MKPVKEKDKCTFGVPYSKYKNASDFDQRRGLIITPKEKLPGPTDYSPNIKV
jgi:hypothetical protein